MGPQMIEDSGKLGIAPISEDNKLGMMLDPRVGAAIYQRRQAILAAEDMFSLRGANSTIETSHAVHGTKQRAAETRVGAWTKPSQIGQ